MRFIRGVKVQNCVQHGCGGYCIIKSGKSKVQFWKDAAKAARERKIELNARTRPLPGILSVYVLSNRPIAFRNLTPVPRGYTDCM